MDFLKLQFHLRSKKIQKISFWLFIVFIHVSPLILGDLDLLEECKITNDDHVTRGNFTCCSASPRSLPLYASLDFETWWEKCAVEPGSDRVNEDPVVSAWRVYRCIVFKGIQGKPLLPSTYSDLMTAKYPGLIKAQILNQMTGLEDENMKFEVDVECLKRTPYPKVRLLRNLFYDTEQEICEGGSIHDGHNGGSDGREHMQYRNQFKSASNNMKKSLPRSELTEILCELCDRKKEMYHRNGDCCSHVSIPFPFIHLPYRYGNSERVRECAEDLADDVGLPADTEFSTHLQYLCYPSCEHFLSGNLEESDLWMGAQILQSQSGIRNIIMKMTPKYFSSKYKQAIMKYVLANFRVAWAETKTFESTTQLSQMDKRNCDTKKLKNLLTSCKTHKLIETIITLYLNNLCLELYPLREPNATTPRSLYLAFAGANTTTPPSTAISNDEVILNFEWGTPHQHHRHHIQHEDSDDDDDEISKQDSRNRKSKVWRHSTTPPTKSHYIHVY